MPGWFISWLTLIVEAAMRSSFLPWSITSTLISSIRRLFTRHTNPCSITGSCQPIRDQYYFVFTYQRGVFTWGEVDKIVLRWGAETIIPSILVNGTVTRLLQYSLVWSTVTVYLEISISSVCHLVDRIQTLNLFQTPSILILLESGVVSQYCLRGSPFSSYHVPYNR